METTFKCPECHSFLNIGKKLVLSSGVEDNKKGLCSFETELGNYNIETNDLNYKEGKLVNFYCPLCFANLTSDIHPNLASILMSEGENGEFRIIFSKIAGEKATYKIQNNKLKCYGIHKDKYKSLIESIIK